MAKDLITARLQNMKKDAETVKNKPNVMQNIATGKEEKPDFMKLAGALVSQEEEKAKKQVEYVKDTIYIRADLFAAMQALVNATGQIKKELVNEAYELYLSKIYKEMNVDMSNIKPIENPIDLRRTKNK